MDFDLFDEIQRIGAEEHQRQEMEKAEKCAYMDQPSEQDVLELYKRVMSMFPYDLSSYKFCDAENNDTELHWIKTEGSRITGRISVRDPNAIARISAIYFRLPDITTYCNNHYDPVSKQITYES